MKRVSKREVLRKLIIALSMCFIGIGIMFSEVYAHPGRTDANGGHWDRKSGTYHFHTGEYAGRSSSGSVSQYKYEPFVPPYDPPTDNPYKTKTNTQDTKTEALDTKYSTKNIIYNVIGIAFFVWLAASFVAYDIEKNNGCISLGILVIIVIYGIYYLIYNYPQVLFIIIAALLLIIALICLTKKLYDIIETHIDNYKKSFLRLQRLITDISETKEQIEKYSCVQFSIFSPVYEIGDDNLPKDIDCTSDWGSSFTLYKTNTGEKFHAKYGCCSAVNPVHIYWYWKRNGFKSCLCKKCAKNYIIPDMTEYEYNLECEKAKEKYAVIENDCIQLKKEIKALHKKCNSLRFKLLLIFSRTDKDNLQNANEKYKEMQAGKFLL